MTLPQGWTWILSCIWGYISCVDNPSCARTLIHVWSLLIELMEACSCCVFSNVIATTKISFTIVKNNYTIQAHLIYLMVKVKVKINLVIFIVTCNALTFTILSEMFWMVTERYVLCPIDTSLKSTVVFPLSEITISWGLTTGQRTSRYSVFSMLQYSSTVHMLQISARYKMFSKLQYLWTTHVLQVSARKISSMKTLNSYAHGKKKLGKKCGQFLPQALFQCKIHFQQINN